MKIRPMGAQVSNADGQTDGHTDMTKLIVAFRNSAKSDYKQQWQQQNQGNLNHLKSHSEYI
jgi:hypothetical protein